ncbi:DUF924 family protein [Nostoc sp. NIES-2111]
MPDWKTVTPREVLDFWFPKGFEFSSEAHRAFFRERMKGGVHEAIRARFAPLTEAAAKEQLEHWRTDLRGRLALIVVLDQFSRSVWEGEAAAYGQDLKAARLALSEIVEGGYDELEPWEKTFLLIAIAHCEGPDHLARMNRVVDWSRHVTETAPDEIKISYRISEDQARLSRDVIAAFGRYPHRNAMLGRPSTASEEPYLARGEFPRRREIPLDPRAAEDLLRMKRNAVTGAPE